MTIMPIFYSCAVALGPEEKPPSGEILSQAMKQVKIRAAWCPPSVIEQLVALPGGFEQAAGLDWMMYTGGPLAPAVGDRLSRVTDLCQLYGSTETGPHTALVPLPENWNYFEWHPLLENEMDPMGDGTFEMVVHKDLSLDWIRHLSQAYPDLETWRTNDLFVQAPHNPKLWRFVGRRDDVIVLSNGEKFNPVNMEGVITGHPLVKGAVIVGTARFQASLIVEPVTGLTDMSTSYLIDEIWPTVEEANSVGPAHGRIFRSKVIVGVPEKPFLRAGKGTIIRGRTTQLYASEVDKLYDEENKEAAGRAPTLASRDTVKCVADFVRVCVGQLMATAKFTDEDDLFVLGMDSLQTLELLKMMQRGLKASLSTGGAEVRLSVATLYANPTVGQLSRYLHRAANGLADAVDSGDASRSSLMASIVEKYTSDLVKNTTRRGEMLCVALTGSTGSLGTHLLEKMLCDKSITKVYCLNRSANALQRHHQNFDVRGKKYDLDGDSVEFLTVKFGEPQLGLPNDKYRELTDSVDVVIHNAWKVDFNHQLASFEKEHIKGVRDLIDLTLSSPRQPHLFFVSSLSSVGNWATCYGNTQPVPELIPNDFNVAMTMGYGESKHVSERIVSAAVQSAGLRGTILRVGQIAGPLAEDGGEWNRTEWFPSLIATSKALGCLPDTMNTIDWIPVDTLAAIIGEIVHREYSAGTSRVFNLVNPHEANWQDLVSTIQKSWQPAEINIVPLTEWLDKLGALGSSGDPETFPALKLLDFYSGYVAEAGLPRGQRPSYQTSNCTGASSAMADLSAINSLAMETWLRQWGF
jgi:thioester reductase-like protein